MKDKSRVVIELLHLPHISFFKNAMKMLKKMNINVDLIVRHKDLSFQYSTKNIIIRILL